MYVISRYKKALIIQILVHSRAKEVGMGESKQMILYNYVFCYKSFIDSLLTYLTSTLYSKYFECLFFCVAPMPVTNLSSWGVS